VNPDFEASARTGGYLRVRQNRAPRHPWARMSRPPALLILIPRPYRGDELPDMPAAGIGRRADRDKSDGKQLGGQSN